MIRDLADSKLARKVAAARRLGQIKESRAVQPLVALLHDPVVEVRLAAAGALARIGDPQAVQPLCDLLKDDSRAVRTAAIRGLAGMRDARASAPLVALLPRMGDEASAALVSIGAPAVPYLIEGLRAAESRTEARQALVRIGAPAVEQLTAVLRNDRSKYVRLAAAQALADIQDPRAAEGLAQALDSNDPALVAAAHRFLVRRGQPESVELLIKALNTYGDPDMAEDLAACGNRRLEEAAEGWGRLNNYVLLRAAKNAGPRWGEGARAGTATLAVVSPAAAKD